MDTPDLCIIFSVVLKPNKPNKKARNRYDSCETDFEVTATANPTYPPMKSCKVVLEDISSKCAAEKLKTLNLTLEKRHKSNNSRPTEMTFLKDLQVKTPIAWAK